MDWTPKNYKRAKQGLQKDLRNGRWWSILIDGFVTDDGNSIPELRLGFLLLCGPATVRKMWSISSHIEYSADECARYNTTKYSDPYWKALVTYIHCSHPNTLTMCEIMRSAAESLVHDGKLRDDVDFNAIAASLKQCMAWSKRKGDAHSDWLEILWASFVDPSMALTVGKSITTLTQELDTERRGLSLDLYTVGTCWWSSRWP